MRGLYGRLFQFESWIRHWPCDRREVTQSFQASIFSSVKRGVVVFKALWAWHRYVGIYISNYYSLAGFVRPVLLPLPVALCSPGPHHGSPDALSPPYTPQKPRQHHLVGIKLSHDL